MHYPPTPSRNPCEDLRVVELIRQCRGRFTSKTPGSFLRQVLSLAVLLLLKSRELHDNRRHKDSQVGVMEVTGSTFRTTLARLLGVVLLACLLSTVAVWSWPRVNFWQQHRIAISLVAELEQSETADCRTALRQIAALGNTAIEALVIAAASEEAEIAFVARRIVEERLASWKIRAAEEQTFDLAEPTGLLAHSLAAHLDAFGAMGQQWAIKLSLELVELAEDLPAAEAVPLLADCSEILAKVPAVGPRMRTASNTATTQQEALPMPEMNIPRLPSEQTISPLRVRTVISPLAEQTPSEVEQEPTPLPRESNWVPEWSKKTTAEPETPQLDSIPDATPLAPPSIADETPRAVPSPDEMAKRIAELKKSSLRELVGQLESADFYTAGAIRAALAERGVTADELPLANCMLSKDSAVRLQLVEDLEVLPARTARRWLKELLSDELAEVRLQALTALATTNDPELVPIARDLAVRDTDRQVADLATRIIQDARKK
jgi:hypothetical protein